LPMHGPLDGWIGPRGKRTMLEARQVDPREVEVIT